MSIRQEAWDAYVAQRATVIAAHEQGLRDTLGGFLTAVELVDVRQSGRGVETLFFSDGDVTLSVFDRDGWVVTVVAADSGGWREVAEVGSLADLALHVPPQVVTDPAVWVEGNLYSTGDVVSHDGNVWRSTVDSNSWEPGTVHSVWVLV